MAQTAIRSTATMGQAEAWALVLAAAGIPHRLESSVEGSRLIVADEDVVRARLALEGFDAEEAQRAAGPRRSGPARPASWFFGLVLGLLLVASFAVTGMPVSGSRWFERGAAVAGLMPAEPWRAVTALTLHLDVAHVVGNAVASALLLPAIGARFGVGVALLLVVAAGAAGNLLAAGVHASDHGAVGASTATFGAIGILGASRLWATAAEELTRWKPWTVPAAALVLLVMLGGGRRADVLAHVMGFASGALLGLVAAVLRRPPGPVAQWMLGILAALVIAGCWVRALA